MEGLELQCFQIISAVGSARSSYIEAIQEAKKGAYENAEKCLVEADEMFLQGHHAHAELIQLEAQGKLVGNSLLLIHAEDQMMSAETFKIFANEMIDCYKRITELEKRL